MKVVVWPCESVLTISSLQMTCCSISGLIYMRLMSFPPISFDNDFLMLVNEDSLGGALYANTLQGIEGIVS